MSREIKFRGRDIRTGNWLYGDLRRLEDRTLVIPTGENAFKASIDDCVHPNSIGQFTELLDKNDKEIYEGDILVWGEGEHKSAPLIVCFKHGSFGYIYCDWFHSFAGNTNFTFNPFDTDVRFEVIGNIHDNPELLKGGEK